MDMRLGLLSGTAFAGVVLAGAVIGNRRVPSALNPASTWSHPPDTPAVQSTGARATLARLPGSSAAPRDSSSSLCSPCP